MPQGILFAIVLASATAQAIPLRPTDVGPHLHRVPCGTFLSSFPATAVRAEIAAAAARDWLSGRQAAQISPLRGLEAPAIPVLAAAAPTQVMSLGSGGDIFRPLRDFPLAGEIHLVDTLSGWGKSPAAVLVEVASRLKALPGAEVRVIARGFTRNLSAEDLCSRDRFYEKRIDDRYSGSPFGWEVHWVSPAAGQLSFKVWLHVANYHDPEFFPALVDRVQAKGPLVGVLVTGAREPEGVSQRKLLETMGRHGAYVFETFAEHFGAEAPGPSTAQYALFGELGYDLVPVQNDGSRRIHAANTWIAVRR